MYDRTAVFGNPIANAVDQMSNLITPDADKTALMADHHLGYSMPIGGVAAYKNKVSPSGVGFDIACGNKAVRLDADSYSVLYNLYPIMNQIWNSISFGVGRVNNDKLEMPEFLADPMLEDIAKDMGKPADTLRILGYNQLGTVGSGNHYVDLFLDRETNSIWVGVHFGSRGLGHKLATHFINKGHGEDGINSKPVLFDVDSQIGKDYIAAMELAGKYAYAGRDWVCNKVASIIGANIVEEVHNHHNFAWNEQIDGENYWVVRKGATPAYPGQRGFIGGSMAENAVIIEGVYDPVESALSMNSTVHGAGRAMSRSKAKGKVTKAGVVKRAPEVTTDMMHDWLEENDVVLRGGGVDESPDCYKRLDEVLTFHSQTIQIQHVLQPIGVAMAGPDTFDPYKD